MRALVAGGRAVAVGARAFPQGHASNFEVIRRRFELNFDESRDQLMPNERSKLTATYSTHCRTAAGGGGRHVGHKLRVLSPRARLALKSADFLQSSLVQISKLISIAYKCDTPRNSRQAACGLLTFFGNIFLVNLFTIFGVKICTGIANSLLHEFRELSVSTGRAKFPGGAEGEGKLDPTIPWEVLEVMREQSALMHQPPPPPPPPPPTLTTA